MSVLRVLLVEDDELDAELVEAALGIGGFDPEVRRVTTREEYLRQLEAPEIDLILADFHLPRFDGMTALALWREKRPELPFLFVSGALGEEEAIRTLRAGATDYVLKDRLERLVPAIRRALREAEERKVRVRAEKALRFVAEASCQLAASLDFDTTTRTAARLPVPFLADWAVVHVLDDSGQLVPAAAFHREERKSTQALLLAKEGVGTTALARQLLGLNIPLVVSHVDEDVWRESAVTPSHRQRLAELGFESVLVVPLATQRHLAGALALIGAKGRVYGQEDVSLAEDLARRVAMALDAARLHRDLQLADRRKDEFLAMLAHELRNPLAPILTAVELLREQGSLGEHQVSRARDVVERQARNMVRLVDDLLDVSRITQGKIQLRRQKVELCRAVRLAVQTSAPLVARYGHTLEVQLPDGPLFLDADPERLEQVLTNLINNAAKYTPPNGRISVRVQEMGDDVRIAVRDTGVGIPKDMLRRVFELFVQVNPGLDRAQGGLGLGLTLVKSLVELHGGQVHARSDGPGKGSEFEVRLPLSGAPRPTEERTITQPIPMLATRCRVLIAEDNPDAREFLADLLQAWGHQVTAVEDGAQAAEVGVREPFDLALIDVGLPELNGYEVAKRISLSNVHPTPLLVALTGYGQPEDRRRALEAGFDLHRVKPMEAAELRALLLRAQTQPPRPSHPPSRRIAAGG